MVIIEALMSLYIKEVLIPEKVIEVVNRFAPIDPESEELPEEAEDAAIYWLNKSCQKLVERIGEEVASLTPTSDPEKPDRSRVPSLSPVEYVWDLSDGCALAALLTFYCPAALHWNEICFNEPMSTADILYNLQMIEAFCQTHLPSDIFFLSVEDFFDCHRVVRQNVLAFVADLLYHFEIKPAECVQTPIYDYNPLLSDDDNIMFNGRSQDRDKHRQQYMPTPAEMKAMSLQHIAWDSDESTRVPTNGRRNSMTSTRRVTPMRSASHSYRRSISQEQHIDQFYNEDNDEELSRYFDALEFDPRSTSSPESFRTPRRGSLIGKRLFNQDIVENGAPHHHQHHAAQSPPHHHQQQHVPIRCSPAAAAEQRLDSRHNQSPGIGFEISHNLAESSSMSEISIARKKEAIMMQSIKRKAEQEERKRKQQEEQARKREEERKRIEEAERKRDEERMKKQKILEEHRLQKTGGSGIWDPAQTQAETSVRQKSKWNIPQTPASGRQVSPARPNSSYHRSNSRDDHSGYIANGDANGAPDMSRYFTPPDNNTGLESSPESILITKETKQQHILLQQSLQKKQPQHHSDHSESENNDHSFMQQQVPTPPATASVAGGDDVTPHRPSTPGVGFVISADVVDNSPVSELTMAKKKEMIMQQSIKRKEEQEARRKQLQEEQARKREEDRKRTEEAERKRDEERMRKQKILEEYRMKKAAEDEEKIGGGTSFVIPAGGRDFKNNTVLLRRGNRPVRPAAGTAKSRPKSLHVNSSMMNDYLSLDPKVSKVTDSVDSSSCHTFDSQPNNGNSNHNNNHHHHHNSSTLSHSSIRTGNSEHSLISSHENSSSSHISPFTRPALPISSTGSSRPPSALSTSSRMLSSPPSTSQFSVMPTMPPVFQRNRGPPSDGASDVGSTFSEYTGPKLFVKPAQKTNRGIILNAIGIVLAGSVNSDLKKKIIEVSLLFHD